MPVSTASALVYKWNGTMYVCLSVITSKMFNISARRLLKAYDESYSKFIRGHKYKGKQ